MKKIATALGFLCSPAASYANGQVLAMYVWFKATGVAFCRHCAGSEKFI